MLRTPCQLLQVAIAHCSFIAQNQTSCLYPNRVIVFRWLFCPFLCCAVNNSCYWELVDLFILGQGSLLDNVCYPDICDGGGMTSLAAAKQKRYEDAVRLSGVSHLEERLRGESSAACTPTHKSCGANMSCTSGPSTHAKGTRCGYGVDTLSGGERQRIAIARVLYRRPRMVLPRLLTCDVESCVIAAADRCCWTSAHVPWTTKPRLNCTVR